MTLRVALMTPYGLDNGGIRHLASVAKLEGAQVRTIFFKQWLNNGIQLPTQRERQLLLEVLADFQPDLIGIGFGSPYFRLIRELVGQIRRENSAAVMLGGIHPTLMPEACIEWVDYVCLGEGEAAFAEFLQRSQAHESLTEIKNLWLNHAGVITRNRIRPLIENVDSIPFRDFSDDEKFFIEDDRIREGEPLKSASVLRVHASRGCPFRCAFCYNSSLRQVYGLRGNYYRRRSVDSVLAEIREALGVLPRTRRIKFDDDSFVHPATWIAEFTNRYPSEVGLTFDLMLNPQAVDESSLWALKAVGLDNVQIGIQSGSSNESECIYERSDPNLTVKRFSKLNKLMKLDVVYDLIFDNPLSTTADKDALLDLLLQLHRPFKLYLYSLTVFPRSSVERLFREKGLITEADVEGEATKSFRQFRLSFDWPRPPEEVFYISLTTLTSKRFIPKRLIRWLRTKTWLRNHPGPLRRAAEIANLFKLGLIGVNMLVRGEVTVVKLREYASFKRMIFQ